MFVTKTKSVLMAGLIVGFALGGLGVGAGLSSNPTARAQSPTASPQAATSLQEPNDEEELVKKLKELIQKQEDKKVSDDTTKDREELVKKLKELIEERENEKIQKVIREKIQRQQLETRLKRLLEEKRAKPAGGGE